MDKLIKVDSVIDVIGCYVVVIVYVDYCYIDGMGIYCRNNVRLLSVNWVNNFSFCKIFVVVFNKIVWVIEVCDYFVKMIGGLVVI